MTSHKIDDEDIERMIDIIGDGELAAEGQERLHREGLVLTDALRRCQQGSDFDLSTIDANRRNVFERRFYPRRKIHA